jgi:hypothetical protein
MSAGLFAAYSAQDSVILGAILPAKFQPNAARCTDDEDFHA